MSTDLPIILRQATEEDLPIILHSWLRGYARSGWGRSMPTGIYYTRHHEAVSHLIARPGVSTTVACAPEDPSTVLGWVCLESAGDSCIVHGLYVKSAFRRYGLARSLLQPVEAMRAVRYSHRPPEYVPVPTSWVYDPYALFITPEGKPAK